MISTFQLDETKCDVLHCSRKVIVEDGVPDRRKELEEMILEEKFPKTENGDEIPFSENDLDMPKRAYTEEERKAAWDTWA